MASELMNYKAWRTLWLSVRTLALREEWGGGAVWGGGGNEKVVDSKDCRPQ